MQRDELMFDKLRDLLNKFDIVMSSDPKRLRAKKPVVTVEAEYGDLAVEGSAITLAHHGPRSGNEAPCIARMIKGKLADDVLQDVFSSRVIGLSHTDLDAVGGILRFVETHSGLQGWQLGDVDFWRLAAFVDTHGAHQIPEAGASESDIQKLWAWWAWERNNPSYPNRDGSITDIKTWMISAVTTLAQIFGVFGEAAAQQRFNAGAKFKAAEDDLSRDSFVSLSDVGCCVRVAPTFVNHLYGTPQGPAKAIVAYDTRKGMITVSKENEAVRFSARELVQQLWGKEAGGHDGIAGSPRNRRMTIADLAACANRVNVWLGAEFD